MHRGNKSNRPNVVVPLETLLQKENSTEKAANTKPIVPIAVGKVGKWGVTSFTSIRTAYRVGLTTPPRSSSGGGGTGTTGTTGGGGGDSAEESDLPASASSTTTPAAVPRPRKFFKSRASAPATPVVLPSAAASSPISHIRSPKNNDLFGDEHPTGKSNSHTSKKEKKVKVEKQKKSEKVKKPEIPPERPTRVSSRTKSRINYNEDESSVSSAAALTTVIPSKIEAYSPITKTEEAPSPQVVSIQEPIKEESAPSAQVEDHPKIVLRISKKALKVVKKIPEENPEPEEVVAEPEPEAPVEPEPEPKKEEEQPRIIKKLCIRKRAEDFAIAREPSPEPEPTPISPPSPPPPSVVVVPPQPEPQPTESKRSLRKRGRPTKIVQEPDPEPPVEPKSPPPAPAPVILPKTPPKSNTRTPPSRQNPRRQATIEPKSPPPPAPQPPPAVEGTRRTRNRAKAMQDMNMKNEVQKNEELAAASSVVAPSSAQAVTTNANQSSEQPSVKLVISKKKGSIFKSRALVNDAGNKRHVYKHKWDAEADDEDPDAGEIENETKRKQEKVESQVAKSSSTEAKQEASMDFGFDEEPKSAEVEMKSLKENAKRPVRFLSFYLKFSSIEVNFFQAPYTYIRDVKKAHQMQEIGEFQELDDDVEYILSALQPDNPISTRCLSALQLASKCITPAFRMHVRAHGVGTKFFKALQDAPNDQNLGLCTAAVLFVLSQDTLNIDLDRDSLELMLNLLDMSKEKKASGSGQTQLQKNRKKVKELCAEIKGLGKATHLNLENINIGTLAMETLLSLTSKRAGEWFKEELRTLGGLDHIMKTVCDCCQQISDYVAQWSEDLLDKLRKIERCLRVLENVTQQNQENQIHVLNYNNGTAVDTLVKFYKLCDTEISLYPTTDTTPKDNPGCIIREALTPTLKVLINLTHPFNSHAEGSVRVGRIPGVFDTSLHLLLQSPNYVPESCVFDISILVLLLLINLTTFTEANRNAIMEAAAPRDFGSQFAKVPAIKALVKYFYKCEELASLAEKNTDAILETPHESKNAKSQEDVEETVTKLLQKAGHHMEHTMLASYVSILVGHLIIDNVTYRHIITKHLRNGSFASFAKILEKYYNFMSLTASGEASQVEHVKSTKKILDYLKELE